MKMEWVFLFYFFFFNLSTENWMGKLCIRALKSHYSIFRFGICKSTATVMKSDKQSNNSASY